MNYRPWQRGICILLTVALCLTSLGLVPGHARAAVLTQDYTFQECDGVDEASLRDGLNSIAQQVAAGDDIDVARIVSEQWLALDIDAVVDREIDAAVARVKREEDYFSRFLSGWSAQKAEELTTRVAGYAFGSLAFRSAIDELSAAIANEISRELEAVSARSASSALLCMQAFIGENYSDTMVSVFEEEIGQKLVEIDYDPVVGEAPVSLLGTHTRSLAGVGVIIGTQIAKRLAQKLAQRIAGRLLGRIVGKAATTVIPVAGWVVGAGLIVWDLIEGGDGALPQIQSALKEESVKAGIRDEIVGTVEPELRRELPKIARAISNDVYSTWLDFKRKYGRVLGLAEADPAFRAILDELPVEDIYRLSTLVDIATETVGPDALNTAIENGQFERVLYLPESSFEILRTSRSMDSVVAWADLAGGRLDDVVALEIYRLKSPADFDKGSLEAVLALNHRPTVTRLLALDNRTIDVLLTLPGESLKELATKLSSEDLRWISEYISRLDQKARNELVVRILAEPEVMEQLKHPRVKEEIVRSEAADEAITFFVAPVDERTLVEDTTKVLSGNVSWRLFLQKYGGLRAIGAGLAALLLVLGVLWLLVRRRNARPMQVIVNVPGEKTSAGIDPSDRKH